MSDVKLSRWNVGEQRTPIDLGSKHISAPNTLLVNGSTVNTEKEPSELPKVVPLTINRLIQKLSIREKSTPNVSTATALAPLTEIQTLASSPSLQSSYGTWDAELFSNLSPGSFVGEAKNLGLDSVIHPGSGTLVPPESVQLSQVRNPATGERQPNQPRSNPDPSAPSLAAIDPELGNLRIQPIPTASSQPWVYFLGRVNYFRSDNVFADTFDPIGDNLIRTGVSLYLTPALGPSTYLTASVNFNFIRYFRLQGFDYNDLQFTTGIYQQLTPNMYGQISWSNQQFYAMFSGIRFLDDHSIRFDLGRSDPLTNQLSLDTAYQLRLSFADPSDRSRVVNYFNVSLAYNIAPELQTAIDYQLVLSAFTQQARNDTYQQLVGRITYQMSPETRVNFIGGLSFGTSSNPLVKFDSSIFGITFDFSLPFF